MQAPSPDLETLAAALLRGAKARGFSIATAESCTGGLIAALLTDVEGLSHVFDRGFVCYSDASKREELGVPAAVLADAGPVSEAAARAMALGALNAASAGLALAVTGFAGASGPGEEAGLVHIAAARRGGAVLHLCQHYGPQPREATRQAAARDALSLALEALA